MTKQSWQSAALIACLLTLLASLAHAAEPSAAEIEQRNIKRRAVEAAIWGMPAVNFERMLQAALDNGFK